jgi:predicted metalloendopeptidase
MKTPGPSNRLFALILLASAPAAALAQAAPAPSPSPGIDVAGMDRAVAPGDDFFRFANGAWLRETEIPADRGGYGTGSIVTELTSARTVELIQSAAKGAEAGSEARKVGDYYASFMDEAAIEAKGLKPIQPVLDAIAAIADGKALSRYIGGTLRADVDGMNATDHYTDNLFGLWVAADFDQPTRYAPFLMQGGLDMPDRAYYLDDTPRMEGIRARHRQHVANVLKLAGRPDAAARGERVFELEGKIARAHWPRADSEDVRKVNNHWTRAEFDTRAPGLDWKELFTAAGLEGQRAFVVWQPSAVAGLSALAAREPLETWKDYLAFHALERHSAALPDAFYGERFAFHGTVLAGTPRRRERWKRAVDATNDALGEAVGRLYVARYFPPASKALAEEMVRNISAAFGKRIDALSWMTPATRARAKAKLAVLKVGVGYPDRGRDYSGLEIVRGDALGNARRAELFAYRAALARLGTPVDRGQWVMTPQTVNAVNLPILNAMNFPAAILQPPYFDAARPAAMNYGAIGSIIGHEISHSFDDQGAQFDEAGRLRNWWTEADREHFEAASARLVRQYDAYRPFPDAGVSGTLTLSENIADVAGLAAAYDGWRMSLAGKPAPPVAGLGGDQQFFVAYAQAWRSKAREATLRQQLLGDSHSPGMYRAATVRNLDPWYAAFDVKPGQAMYLAPADRVRVW